MKWAVFILAATVVVFAVSAFVSREEKSCSRTDSYYEANCGEVTYWWDR